MTSYPGRCHCGVVRLDFRTDKPPGQWPLRRCTCSFCVRFGGVYTSDPSGEIAVHSNLKLKRYRFGQRTADFLSCPTCGVYVGAMCEIEGSKLVVLNIRVLDGVELDLGKARPMDFDEETIELRNSRRRRHWTPLVLSEPPD